MEMEVLLVANTLVGATVTQELETVLEPQAAASESMAFGSVSKLE